MTADKCVHHWLINSSNVGRCRKCDKVKDFGRLLGEGDGKKRARFSLKKRQGNRAVKRR